MRICTINYAQLVYKKVIEASLLFAQFFQPLGHLCIRQLSFMFLYLKIQLSVNTVLTTMILQKRFFNKILIVLWQAKSSQTNNKLSFLGIEISRDKNSFINSVYHKPTFSGVFSHFDSFIPRDYKFNLVSTNFLLLFYFL